MSERRSRHRHFGRRQWPTWTREDEPEFGRVLGFADAVYAIALTLLALDLRIDRLAGNIDDPAAMLTALDDLTPQLVAFGVAFLLLARYWLAHHDFMSRIERIDHRLLVWTLVYLGAVAILPFPASLIGEYESNPISGVIFATSLAAISGLEAMLLWHAQSNQLMREESSPEVQRWEVLASIQPAFTFLLTIPLAFISPTVMLLSWLLLGPLLGYWVNRSRPDDAL